MKTNREYVDKEELLEFLYRNQASSERCAANALQRGDVNQMALHEENASTYESIIEWAVNSTGTYIIDENTSDGYHTFKELYHHRAILFSVIVALFPELSWKSKWHHDGTMYDGMFIVGINTPSGQATYHYDIDPYWNLFRCRELDKAPEWDGHTPDNAIRRISTLKGYSSLIHYGRTKA